MCVQRRVAQGRLRVVIWIERHIVYVELVHVRFLQIAVGIRNNRSFHNHLDIRQKISCIDTVTNQIGIELIIAVATDLAGYAVAFLLQGLECKHAAALKIG